MSEGVKCVIYQWQIDEYRRHRMEHLEILDEAKCAADAVFSDFSVSPEEAKGSLEELLEHIKDMMSTL